MMQVPDLGAFVRALLPVRLVGGHTVTFGVWVGIQPADLQRAFAAWWQQEYAELTLDGALANAVPPWQMLAAPVSLEVRNPDETPYWTPSRKGGVRCGAQSGRSAHSIWFGATHIYTGNFAMWAAGTVEEPQETAIWWPRPRCGCDLRHRRRPDGYLKGTVTGPATGW